MQEKKSKGTKSRQSSLTQWRKKISEIRSLQQSVYYQFGSKARSRRILFYFSYTKYTKKSIVIVKKFELEIFIGSPRLDLLRSKKTFLELCLSVCASVCEHDSSKTIRAYRDEKFGINLAREPGVSLVEAVQGRMKRNTLSDLSGTSLSPAREMSGLSSGARYQGVDCSTLRAIEGVTWWRSLDFLWQQK
ncbi:hypothetical protein AVEN_134960-1 [Araneus ventricosus]|uniref:Uncharacterized protein n=1 Tax=Araneus ventricosus TaxID=182803 RepID=A0A4Y2CH48_ARAVE|nr:hypothetical protein AVEN_134960-1 [Araneus ventricosus]